MAKQSTALRELEIKIRLLKEQKQEEDNALAVAIWETNLPIKAEAASRKRREEAFKKESALLGEQIRSARRQRLEELYARDDEKYQNELNARGLSFRRQRL